MKYANRGDAGHRLASALTHLKDRRPGVLGLPRGGVAIGFEIAQALDAPLDIVLRRKLECLGNPNWLSAPSPTAPP